MANESFAMTCLSAPFMHKSLNSAVHFTVLQYSSKSVFLMPKLILKEIFFLKQVDKIWHLKVVLVLVLVRYSQINTIQLFFFENSNKYRARNNYWRVTIKYYRNFIIEVTETCNTAMEREFCQILGIFLGCPKKYYMKRNSHFSGKWQNRKISQFPRYR